jgi:dsRNA-specific ribonuclease
MPELIFDDPASVNGIKVGIGSGDSKQVAKEEAARQAFYAMGWAPRKIYSYV